MAKDSIFEVVGNKKTVFPMPWNNMYTIRLAISETTYRGSRVVQLQAGGEKHAVFNADGYGYHDKTGKPVYNKKPQHVHQNVKQFALVLIEGLAASGLVLKANCVRVGKDDNFGSEGCARTTRDPYTAEELESLLKKAHSVELVRERYHPALQFNMKAAARKKPAAKKKPAAEKDSIFD